MSCVLYGECGKSSIFTPELPCVGTFEPQKLSNYAHSKLEELCGPMPRHLCCSESQVETLSQSIQKAEAIIGACPACSTNFVNLWCQFTCSPRQIDFVDVLETKQSLAGHEIPSEVDFHVASEFGQGLYDSCKDVTFGATNGRAMDLIGGGATNYRDFLKFLGDEKPMLGGSAFQINFPDSNDSRAFNSTTFGCSDPDYKCACVDCPVSCPALEPIDPPASCTMWGINCMSLVLLAVYGCALLLLGAFYYSTKRSRSAPLHAIVDEDVGDALVPPTPTRSGSSTLVPYRFNTILQNAFERLGYICARFPLLVITLCTLFVLVSSIGLLGIELLEDPAELWVGPKSLEAREKSFYEDNFGMFYRTEQMFIVNETGPVLQDYATVEWLFDVESRVNSLHCNLTQDSLEDFCFMPLGEKGGCVVESITSYFGSIKRLPEQSWRQRLSQCLKSPVSCLPKFQQPITPNIVLGPYKAGGDPLSTNAVVTTWLLNNHNDPAYLGRVEQWEYQIEELFAEIEEEATQRGLHFSYNLESSLARELSKSSTADIKVIVLSYILMFVYASFSLGGRMRAKDPLVHSKFSLGLGGIIIVLLSVISAIGVCASAGVKLTLIITEVIPFLVLAVGVDNIFLLVHDFQLVNDLYPQYSVEERVSKAVGLIGPSIFLSSSCEIVAILIGVNVSMPAVHNFAIYSGVAVLINSCLQLTMFVSAMTLDQYRIQARRVDCIPCLRARERPIDPDETQDLEFIESQQDNRHFSIFIRHLSPYIFRRRAKLGIVAVFVLWLAISLSVIPSMEMGLDQRYAVPSDSFLVDYFTDVSQYFQAGPPVYFVVSGATPELKQDQQKLCGRFSTCDEYSLVNIIEEERKRPEVSYLSVPAASWIDDFFQWLNPRLDCCFEDNQGRLCESEGPQCHRCWQGRDWDPYMNGFPQNHTFDVYASMWLNAPMTTCPLAGKAPYGNAVSFGGPDDAGVVASNFRSQHVPLKTQADYINSYASARRIADSISDSTGFDVFPYSVYYVYFAQYRTLVSDTLRTLGSAVLVVFILSGVILGSVRTAGVVAGVVVIMVCNVCGLMKLFGVSLNALSLVNLLICVGIGVEFCIHIARAFTFTHKVNSLALQGVSKTERAFNALTGTGGTVFGGIAVTKLIGVSVLAFAKSKIFEVYYFRMWVALIFCATLHSLVLLPVLLSFAGGQAYLIAETGLIDQFRI